jgi:malonyl CoA-acyl carrier protein transacylase
MAPEATSAILFPGQGVGDESSRELVTEHRPDLLDLATELAGDDPFARMGDGTAFAQPAVYCASIAGFERLGRPVTACFAGHSLGEVSALAAAGAIADEDGVRIVVARGRAMENAARWGAPGAMLAVGSDRGAAERLASAFDLVVANENSPEQFVLSGSVPGIDGAQEAARQDGIRVKRLAVTGAFHTEAMASGVAPFRRALEDVEFRPPDAPVISSTSGEPFGEDVRDSLAASLVSPIRWTAVMRRLESVGVRRYIDVGPGKVLAGLVRRTIEGALVETATSRESAVA